MTDSVRLLGSTGSEVPLSYIADGAALSISLGANDLSLGADLAVRVGECRGCSCSGCSTDCGTSGTSS